jgi:hypothetical protein
VSRPKAPTDPPKGANWANVLGAAILVVVEDTYWVTCPYCGEQVEVYVEPDVTGSFVQDCDVCCNPWRIRVTGKRDERSVDVERADGSD